MYMYIYSECYSLHIILQTSWLLIMPTFDFNDYIALFFVDTSFTEDGVEGCEDGSEKGGEDEEEV